MNLSFVRASESDIPVIFNQAKQLIDTYEDIADIDYDKVLAWVRRKLETYIGEYCCVLADGEKCGYYHLCQDGELDDVYVLPGFQNRGIGSEILRKCMDESESTLYLYVFSRNIRAISLYERFGFVTCQTVGATRLIMRQNG